MIVGVDGAVVPGSLFPHLFKDYDYVIRQFQVVQEVPGAVVLKVVKGPRFDERGVRRARSGLRRYLGQQMRIDVEFVDGDPDGAHGQAADHAVPRCPIDFQALGSR